MEHKEIKLPKYTKNWLQILQMLEEFREFYMSLPTSDDNPDEDHNKIDDEIADSLARIECAICDGISLSLKEHLANNFVSDLI